MVFLSGLSRAVGVGMKQHSDYRTPLRAVKLAVPFAGPTIGSHNETSAFELPRGTT
jgi:hypothetical protein